jgi:hypothetical protein
MMEKSDDVTNTYGQKCQIPRRGQRVTGTSLLDPCSRSKSGLLSSTRKLQPIRSGRAFCPWEVNHTRGTIPVGGVLAALIEAREEAILAQYDSLAAQKRELKTWKALYNMLNLDT